MEALTSTLEVLRQFFSRFGAYFMIEILLPGGTVLALLLYLYRRGKWGAISTCPATSSTPTSSARTRGHLKERSI